jgi:CheY-like chemotaxis protein
MQSATHPATVLVADDEISIRSLLEVILTADGHEVVTVSDGREALAYLKDHTPDLAILDIAMPFIDGLDVCSRMKRVNRLRHTPVMILTGNADDRVRSNAEYARADEVVFKPLSGKNLRQTVADLIAKGAAARDAAS